MFFVVAAPEPDPRLDAHAAGHHQPARPALHGRDLRLPAADGESAVEEADDDHAQTGPRLRPRHPARPRRTRSISITRRCRTSAPGCSAACKPSATRCACSTASKARLAAQDAKFDRGEMEKLLSALGNRIFLMNNVHEDHPGRVPGALDYLLPQRTAGQGAGEEAHGSRPRKSWRTSRRERWGGRGLPASAACNDCCAEHDQAQAA